MRKRLGLSLAFLMAAAVTPALAFEGASPSSPPKVDPVLARQLLTSTPTDKLLVFVHADDAATSAAAVKEAGLVQVAQFKRIGVTVAAGEPARVRRVMEAKGVTYVQADQELGYDLATSVKAVRSEQARDQLTDDDGASLDGRGVTVAVNDTGIDSTHPMFAKAGGGSRVVRNLKLNPACFAPRTDCTGPQGDAPDDLWIDSIADTDTTAAGGHGTHVSGIAAGGDVVTKDGRSLHGNAPGASLVGLSHGAGLSLYGTSAALNWVLEHHDAPCGDSVPAADCPPVRVVTQSISAPEGNYNPNDTIAKLQDALVADGVVVVWSAGNFGTDQAGTPVDHSKKSTVYSFKQSPTPGVITVANYDDKNTGTRDGTIDPSSSKGKIGDTATYPDISAPGTAITSACRAYLAVCSTGLETADPNYNTISGTSMAAPHVAGAMAQLLQAVPSLTPAQVEDILEDSAYKFGSGYAPDLPDRNADNTTSFDKGHGLLDVVAAASLARNLPDPGLVSPCGPGLPVVTDQAGDANDVIVATPLPSEPGLDVREGRVSWDGSTSRLAFTIKVTDLAEQPPTASSGWYFDYEFTYAGQAYYLSARRSLTAESYSLGQFAPTRTTRVSGLQGSFNNATDTVTIYLSNADLARSNTPIPAFGSGAALSGFKITSRRDLVAAVPNTDTAAGLCGYVIP